MHQRGIVQAGAHSKDYTRCRIRYDTCLVILQPQLVDDPVQLAEIGLLPQVYNPRQITALRGEARTESLEFGDFKGIGGGHVQADKANELQWKVGHGHTVARKIYPLHVGVDGRVLVIKADPIIDQQIIRTNKILAKRTAFLIRPL